MTVCNLSPHRLPRMQDQKFFTLRWSSSSRWGRECVSVCFEYNGGQYIMKWYWGTKVNILRLTVGYLNATLSRNTWKPEPEIGNNSCCQTSHTPQVDRSGCRFAPSRPSRSGFWTGLEPNRPIFGNRTRTAGGLPGPVANTSRRPSSRCFVRIFPSPRSVPPSLVMSTCPAYQSHKYTLRLLAPSLEILLHSSAFALLTL